MHLYFMTRGVKHVRDMFVTQMQSQFFKWKRKDLKTGKEVAHMVQGALRPIELWEYVFPEEHLDEVCSMLNLSKEGYWGKGKASYALPFVRSALGAKKLKSYKKVPTGRIIPREHLGVECIGIKKDKVAKLVLGKSKNKKGKWEEEGFMQEML